MKILEILPMADWAGTARYMFDLIGGLTEIGHEVNLLTRDLPVTYRFDSICEVFHWPLKKDSLSYMHIPQLCRLLRKHSYDVIHVHGGKDTWVVMVARMLSKTNIVVCSTRHDLHRSIHKDIFHKWLYKNMEASICISKTLQEDYLAKNPFIIKEQAPLVYNGVDTNLFSFSDRIRCEKRLELGLQTEIAIGIFARVCKQKGIHLAVEAIKLLQKKTKQSFRLLVFGTEAGDEYCQEIRRQIEDEKLADVIKIAGFQEDVSAAMMAMDIILAPTIEKESFGLSVCEAMSLERAVVVTDMGGQAETVVHGKTGLVVAPEKGAIAVALETLLEDKALRDRMAKLGRNRVCEFFSRNRMAVETEKVFIAAREKKSRLNGYV